MDIAPVSINDMAGSVAHGAANPVQRSNLKHGDDQAAKKNAEITPDGNQIKQMLKEIVEQLNYMNVKLNFTPYGQNNEKMAIIVSDQKTGKVIREIPPKEIQNLYLKMNELIGIIFNHHV